MRRVFRIALVFALSILPVACGGGGSAPVVPVANGDAGSLSTAQSQAAQSQTGQSLLRASTPHFSAQELPAGFTPVAIMKDGQIPGSQNNVATIYAHHQLRRLASFGGYTSTTATSVNTRGEAVGFASGGPPPKFVRALLFSGNRARDLGGLSYGEVNEALTINDREQIVGTSGLAIELTGQGIVSFGRNGGATYLGHPGAVGNINESGRFAATWYQGPTTLDGAVALDGVDNTLKPVFAAEYRSSSATWINERGDVVGDANLNGQLSPLVAFIATPKGTAFLPLLPGSAEMIATGINDREEVVGYTESNSGEQRPFYYASGHTYDLNSLTPAGLGLSNAVGIDDRGRILAQGTRGWYLLKPAGPDSDSD